MAYYHSKYSRPRNKKKSRVKRFFIWFFIIVLLLLGGAGYYVYRVVFDPNVWTPEGKSVSIYIPTGSQFEDVREILYSNGLIIHRKNFEWWAQQKKYTGKIKPGHYVIEHGLSNEELINMLRSGKQTPVRVTFNNIRNLYQLSGKVSKQIEADSISIIDYLKSPELLVRKNIDSANLKGVFLPNTYEFWWNTTSEEFVERMFEENEKFWNTGRLEKVTLIGLTKEEVVTLASIVEKETNKNDEKPAIAGVYLNRLRSKWRLQADPTVVYAIGDFSIRRVLNKHKKYDSPYNTYENMGLPPGPICIPSIASIDAVLNYEKHDFMYFCARADLSGYHAFAETNAQHRRNARAYQKALDERGIFE
ncbi:MAG: endolytic transglycosylase MltG [bacterium]|jgi:UPF0755 protein